MSGAAQRDNSVELGYELQATGTDSGLKAAVAERLAAHRDRRAAARTMDEQTAQRAAQVSNAAIAEQPGSRVRDAVAARYQQSLSYRDFLQAEAERALHQARAEAEVASRNAAAVAEAKIRLMEELEQWTSVEAGPRGVVREPVDEVLNVPHLELIQLEAVDAPVIVEFVPEMRVEFAEATRIDPATSTTPISISENSGTPASVMDQELADLEQEIEFRLAPEPTDTYLLEAVSIPGNVIEFPRQLVAPRKARPRLAEGPLRGDAPAAPQLRIFEVEAEQISAAPAVESNAAPEWQSLYLDSSTVSAPHTPVHAQLQFTLQPQTASLGLRLKAAIVDFVWIAVAFASFAGVAVKLIGPALRMLPVPMIAASAAGTLLVLYVVYELLFFTLTGQTPGMRFARIGLCTFGDRNPSRKAMRRRVLATLVAACPLGLGLAWACLDEERMGWHDRMSRMYQRAY